MKDEAEKFLLTVSAESRNGGAGGVTATSAGAALAARQPTRCASECQRSGGAMDPISPPGAMAAAAVATPGRSSRPSSSGSTTHPQQHQQVKQQQRSPRDSDRDGSKSPGQPGSATQQLRKSSGRAAAAPAALTAAAPATAAAASGGADPSGDGGAGMRRSSHGSVAVAAASVASSRRPSAIGDGAAAGATPSAVSPSRSPSGDERSGPAGPLQSRAGAATGTPPTAASGLADGAGSSSRRGSMVATTAAAASSRPLSRTNSNSDGRQDSVLTTPSKPPRPSQIVSPELPAAAASGGGGTDGLRRALKRTSSSSNVSGLAGTEAQAVSDGAGDGVATVRTAAAGSGAAGVRERRISAADNQMPYRAPRESSCSGTAPAASLLLPFRASSSGQHPSSPLLQQHKAHHQQQPQQQLHTPNRAVRFSPRESYTSGVGTECLSPMGRDVGRELQPGSALTTPLSHRRVSDGSSCVGYNPGTGADGGGGGREVGCLAAPPPPPPPGLLRRPSDDSVVGAAAAAMARRDRSAQPAPANVMWAVPAAPSAAGGRPASGGSSRGDLQRPAVDGGATAAAAAAAAGGNRVVGGGRRVSGAEPHAVRPAAAGGAAAGIRRAVELAPLSLPGGPDGPLREALARAAVANVAALTGTAAAGGGSAQLPEPDFGYTRVVEQHRRQQQQHHHHHHHQEQQRREQQQHQQREQDQQEQQQQQPPEQEQAPGRPSQRTSLQVPTEAESEGPAAAVPVAVVAASPPSSPRAAAAASAPGTVLRTTATKPPLAAKSTRSVLKTAAPHGAAGTGAAAAPSEAPPLPGAAASPASPPPTTHGSAITLATTSHHRLFGLRRPSSKTSITDSEVDNFTSPGTSAAAAATTRRGVWGATFGRGDAAATAAAPDPDPMGLRTQENVEIRIHCITFNMGGASPAAAALPDSLFTGSYLSLDAAADSPHLYVFATQESGPLAEWEAAVRKHLEGRYTRVAVESLMSIHILLFAVPSLVPYITDVQTSSVATGVGNVLGNKGGVAVTFSLLGARVLLVGAHFAAHTEHWERRNADFHRICAGLFAPPSTDGAAAGAAAGAVAGPAGTGPAPPRSLQATPERQRAGGEGGFAAAAARTPSESDAVPAASAASARKPPIGPTLSRGNGVTFNVTEPGGDDAAASSDAGGDAGNGGGGGEGVSQGGRTLTRALSTSSVSSVASNVSAYPAGGREGALRTRTPSFWGGLGSFATAQRHTTALLAHFDVVLWMGDLNYRIKASPEIVKHLMEHNMTEVMLANDQLQQQQKKGNVLQGFKEQTITFPPTFKFLRGTDEYDYRRSPSWTDRILYLVNGDPVFVDLAPKYYMAVQELRTSDHKPVIAGFELSISPQHAGDNRHARQRGCIIS